MVIQWALWNADGITIGGLTTEHENSFNFDCEIEEIASLLINKDVFVGDGNEDGELFFFPEDDNISRLSCRIVEIINQKTGVSKMKKTMSINEVANELLADEYANWSHNGAHALAAYFEELESDLGEEIEFDRVAIRCDYSEYGSCLEWAIEYWGSEEEAFKELGLCIHSTQDEEYNTISQYIWDNGQLIEFDGGIIVSNF